MVDLSRDIDRVFRNVNHISSDEVKDMVMEYHIDKALLYGDTKTAVQLLFTMLRRYSNEDYEDIGELLK